MDQWVSGPVGENTYTYNIECKGSNLYKNIYGGYLQSFFNYQIIEWSQSIPHEIWMKWTILEYLRWFKESEQHFRGVHATKKVSIVESVCKY